MTASIFPAITIFFLCITTKCCNVKWTNVTIAIILLFAACRKDKAPTIVTSGKIVINISHKVDAAPLIFDTIAFVNQAGNEYNVEKLQYYISNCRFYNKAELLYTSSKVSYIDAHRDASPSVIIDDLNGMPVGKYDSIAFTIGVDARLNISNGLTATFDNISMGWPDAMGGGYHFIKIEGHWRDGVAISGYAIHLGSNGYQVQTGVKCDLQINGVANDSLAVVMNVNEWFTHPHTYDFNTGSFSMGDSTLMRKLSDNGKDVFQRP